MKDFELIFDLKQWTPMIHFQSNQSGATLRASDVKPRLDAFIYEWCTKNNEKVHPEWIIGKDSQALNYKMSISSKGQPKICAPLRDVYFGNMGNSKPISTVLSNDISLKIICFDGDLRKVINKCLETFFLVNSFGSRSSRGSGSFTLKSTNRNRASVLLKNWYGSKIVYKLEYNTGTDIDTILKDGALIYQVLKSGYNFKDVYIKSFLTKYFLLDKKIGGEKRYLKQQGVAPSIGSHRNNGEQSNKPNEYKYIRGLLGSADGVSYLNDTYDKRNKTTVKISPVNGNDIQRIPSPIFYKICDNTLFIIPKDINKEIYGKEYEFSGIKKRTLPIPDNFDIDDMLKRYVAYLNAEESADKYVLKDESLIDDLKSLHFIKQGLIIERCE